MLVGLAVTALVTSFVVADEAATVDADGAPAAPAESSSSEATAAPATATASTETPSSMAVSTEVAPTSSSSPTSSPTSPTSSPTSSFGDASLGAGLWFLNGYSFWAVDAERRVIGPVTTFARVGLLTDQLLPGHTNFVVAGGLRWLFIDDVVRASVQLTALASDDAAIEETGLVLGNGFGVGATAGLAVEMPVVPRVSVRVASDLVSVGYVPNYFSEPTWDAVFNPSVALRVAL